MQKMILCFNRENVVLPHAYVPMSKKYEMKKLIGV